jgi:hypothetical protein
MLMHKLTPGQKIRHAERLLLLEDVKPRLRETEKDKKRVDRLFLLVH